jgi:hypothetical protein
VPASVVGRASRRPPPWVGTGDRADLRRGQGLAAASAFLAPCAPPPLAGQADVDLPARRRLQVEIEGGWVWRLGSWTGVWERLGRTVDRCEWEEEFYMGCVHFAVGSGLLS